MSEQIKRIKLKGNESFNFREGWLRKGMRCVANNPYLFSSKDVMEQLGVGSKMVKSIKHWLLATGLCEEYYAEDGHTKGLRATEKLGQVIEKNDPYFDDIFTLFILHYHMVKNDKLCIVWNIFFNEFKGMDFTREEMIEICSGELLKKMAEGATFSDKLFSDDCSSLIRMYLPAGVDENPEESLHCPLTALRLLSRSSSRKNAFTKATPPADILDKYAILYVLVSNIDDTKKSVSINDLLNESNNIGKVFNLNRIKINDYLDQLKASGFVTVNRTAGLDMVYLNRDISPDEVLVEYYRKAQER